MTALYCLHMNLTVTQILEHVTNVHMAVTVRIPSNQSVYVAMEGALQVWFVYLLFYSDRDLE